MVIPLPEEIEKTIKLLEIAGFQAWLVGGSVRDHLLGQVPQDWDVVTSADPQDIERILRGSIRLVPVGAKFNTISLIAPGVKGEISSFRGQDLLADLGRRDFTINAMAWHPTQGMVDPYGGMADLEGGCLRCPGAAKEAFASDPLRMLRAVRFAITLGFTIDAQAWTAIECMSGRLAEVSRERIQAEFSAILTSSRPGTGLGLLVRSKLVEQVVPELMDCVGFQQQNPHHNLDVYQHIVAVVEGTPPDLVLRLAALFHDLGKPSCLTVDEQGIGHFYGHEKISAELASRIMHRLRYSNETIATVRSLVLAHMLWINYPQMNAAKLLALVGAGNIEKLFTLQEADVQGGADGSLDSIMAMREKVEEALTQGRAFSRGDLKISGHDLLAMGISPGVQVGRLLDVLLAAVLEDPSLNTKEKLLQLARRWR